MKVTVLKTQRGKMNVTCIFPLTEGAFIRSALKSVNKPELKEV